MPLVADDVAALMGAVLLAAAGGEAFLRSIVGAAAQLKVPPAVIATTLAAFATSSPELTVSTVAALSGHPEVGLGDALGSNVVNIALIFGLALLLGAIRASCEEFGRDFALALAIPVLTLIFAMDGRIGRGDGAILLLMFVLWLGQNLRTALRHREHAATIPASYAGPGPALTLALGVFGLGALIAAGRLFVVGATGAAVALRIDAYVVGVLVVAIGTSLPELVTVLLSRLHRQDEVGIGTLLGSNLFNGMAIVGVASGIQPIAVPAAELAVTLACGLAALLLLLPSRGGVIPSRRGLLLLALYGAFIWVTLATGARPRP